MKTFVFMWRLIRYRPLRYSSISALWILVSVAPVIPGLLIQQFFNALAKSGYLTPEIWGLIALFVATALVKAILILWSGIMSNRLRFSIATRSKKISFSASQKTKARWQQLYILPYWNMI